MLKITGLKTEYKINPIGLGTKKPRLSWMLDSKSQNTKQAAFYIIASTQNDNFENEDCIVWNTGKIQSDESVHIEYSGEKLKSGIRIYWKVKVWDNHGNESDWSETAFFETAFFKTTEWKANWIEPDIDEDVSKSTPCPFLRKEFSANGVIEKATVYVSAHGLYEVLINGQKPDDQLFTPGWTSYNKRIQYQVYDITNQLVNGKNAIGVILGDGWYRGFLTWTGDKNLYGDKTALILQLQLTYKDGSEEMIVSDDSWKAATGPILKSDIYNGETYDARLELPGWSKAGFDDTNWKSVLIKDHEKNILVASDAPPVRITQSIKPIEKFITPKGELVFDLGQNIVGWVQFILKGEKNSKIILQHAEVLDNEGNFYTDNLREAKAEDQYIFKGEEIETYEPRFTFHGFRYIKISGYKGEITVDDISARVIHSDMMPLGDFKCSDEMINRLQKNIQWGLRGNFLDVPTDCPQRDERLGWTGDAQVFAPTACFNMNASGFFAKWLKDLAADQKKNGSVPWVVPMVVDGGGGTGWSDGYGATGWADAAITIPWTVYQAYGDKRILETQYDSMKAWFNYMKNEAGETYLFNTGFHFGDWLSFAEYMSYKYNAPDYGYAGAHTDKELISTAYFYYSTGLLEKTATILGKNKEAEEYEAIQIKIKETFGKEFLTQTGRLTSNTQTAYTLALVFGLIPDELEEQAAKRLVDDVNHFDHLTTGFLGTPLLCHALTDFGYPDIAYKLLFNKRYPSWLYPITKGATTIWERWDCIKPDGTFQDVGMNSFNHYAYGAVGDWLYTKVVGLQTDPEYPGYKKIIIRPYPTDKLTFAKAEFDSGYGKIVSHWKRDNNKLTLRVVIPPNTTSTIYIPAQNTDNVMFNGKTISEESAFKIIGTDDGRVIIETGSGEYFFKVKS